jgi:hypothetical protein
MPTYLTSISGVIKNSSQPNLVIEVWDLQERFLDRCGVATLQVYDPENSSIDRAFSFEVSQDLKYFFYHENCGFYIKIYSSGSNILETAFGRSLIFNTKGRIEWTLNNNDEFEIDLTSHNLYYNKEYTGKKSKIKGNVKQYNGYENAWGILLGIYDTEVIDDRLLGNTMTDKDGNFETELYVNHPKPNIIVKAFNDDEPQAEIGASDIHQGYKSEYDINLNLFESKYILSEYETLKNKLEVFYELTSTDDLEGASEQKLEIIANELMFELTVINSLLKANTLKSQLGSESEEFIFYGLSRIGLVNELNQLFVLSKNEVKDGILTAANQRIIPEHTEIEAIAISAEILSRVKVNYGELTIGPSTGNINELIAASGLNSGQIEAVKSHFLEYQNDIDGFYSELSKILPTEGDRILLSNVIQSNTICYGSIGVLNILGGIFGTTFNGKVINETKDLSKLEESDWVDIIDDANNENEGNVFPNIFEGSYAQKRTKLISVIGRNLEILFPTDYLLKRMVEESDPEESDTLASKFSTFRNNNPSFDIEKTYLNSFFRTASFTGIDGVEDFKHQLHILQRCYVLSSGNERYETAKVLMQIGTDSSNKISNMSWSAFRTMFLDAGGDIELAPMIYERAQKTNTLMSELIMTYNHDLQGAPNAMRHQTGVSQEIENLLVDDDPNLANLFGSQDYCSCKHCRSIYSPGAYLADTLQCLKGGGTASENAFQVLIGTTQNPGRRIELCKLLLNCKNANTALPYIDLVNEILELGIAKSSNFTYSFIPTFFEDYVPTLQTKGTTEELLAHPENRLKEVYFEGNGLNNNLYPWSLPFNYHASEIKAYLGHLKIMRWEIMHTLQSSSAISSTSISPMEVIGIPSLEFELIKGISPTTDLHLTWGLTGNFTDLNAVNLFLKKSGLSFKELEEMLRTRFVNRSLLNDSEPENNIKIKIEFLESDPCNVASANIIWENDDPLVELDYMRIQRFLRLWRKLKWSMRELDHALMVFGAIGQDTISEVILRKIADIVRLQTLLKLPLHDIISYYGNIYIGFIGDTDINYKGQYERIFYNKNKVNPPQPEFLWNPNFTALDVDSVEVSINDVKTEAVKSSLGLSSDELRLSLKLLNILQLNNLNEEVWDINIYNLSILYRNVSIAKALKLNIVEMLNYIKVFQIEVFNGGSQQTIFPHYTLAFIDRINRLRSLKINLSELLFLSNVNDVESVSNLIPQDSIIKENYKLLVADLTEIVKSFTDNKDFDDTITEKRLFRLTIFESFAETNVSKIMTIIRNPQDIDDVEMPPEEEFQLLELFLDTVGISMQLEREAFLGKILGFTAYSSNPTLPPVYVDYKEKDWERRETINEILGAFLLDFELRDKVLNFVTNTFTLERNLSFELIKNTTYTRIYDGAQTPQLVNIFGLFLDLAADNLDANIEVYIMAYRQLSKISMIINKAGIDYKSFAYFFKQREFSGAAQSHEKESTIQIDLHLFNTEIFDDIYFDIQLISAVECINLMKNMPDVGIYLPDLFLIEESNNVQINDNTSEKLAAMLELSESDLEKITIQFGVEDNGTPIYTQFNRIEYFTGIQSIKSLSKLSNASITKLINWTSSDENDFENIASEVISTVRSKYDEKSWLKVARPIRDIVRQNQCDALSDWLVAHGGLTNVDSREDLYAYYLIDSQMTSCMLTSRLRLAMSSVQLFVMRCLMNLEPNVNVTSYDAKHWEEWKWRKTYRVWEANRKVFCYPENWIEPELRDDKSEFFEELEAELSQGELNPESVEKAYMNYFKKVQEVSNIEIIAMTREGESLNTNPDIDNYYIFGRTKNKPYALYYRVWYKKSYFSDWKKVEIDFEGNHLVPAFFNNKLTLFWPLIKEKKQSDPDTGASYSYSQIQIAYSVLNKSGWTAKKIVDANYNKFPIGRSGAIGRLSGLHHIFISKKVTENMITLAVNFEVVKANTTFANVQFEIYPDYSAELKKAEILDLDRSNFGIQNTTIINQNHLELKQLRVAGEGKGFGPKEIENENIPLNMVEELEYSLKIENKTLLNKSTKSQYRVTWHDENLAQIPIYHYPFLFQEKDKSYLIHKNNAKYEFKTFFHPYINQFMRELGRDGVNGLLNPMEDTTNQNAFQNGLRRQTISNNSDFTTNYDPDNNNCINPVHKIEFNYQEAYSIYNWEIFYHIPMYIADRLSRNQQFEAAQKWYHYVFNPTDSSEFDAPAKYWMLRPFYEEYANGNIPPSIQKLMDLLNGGNSEVAQSVEAWRKNPFKPHLIARHRTGAYMKNTVVKYLDNIISWGDMLFRQDTMESTNEAMQLYVLAAYILGKKPIQIEKKESADKSFCELTNGSGFDDFSNALAAFENRIILHLQHQNMNVAQSYNQDSKNILGMQSPRPIDGDSKYNQSHSYYVSGNDTSRKIVYPSMPDVFIDGDGKFRPLTEANRPNNTQIKKDLYFCIPHNEKMTSYWDTVGDRLFKLRNCMNIEGRVRQLPLFDPPIDPAALVRAAAAGLDIGSVMADFNAPLPNYRFTYILAKTKEFLGTVKSLGQSILSAYEKRDAEAISLLKSGNEIEMMESIVFMKKLQIEESKANLVAAEKSLPLAQAKQTYYSSRQFMNEEEKRQEEQTKKGNTKINVAATMKLTASVLAILPDIDVSLGIAAAVKTGVISGKQLGQALGLAAENLSLIGAYNHQQASIAGVMGGYKRRAEDWKFQADQSALEIQQIEKQIAAAQIRISIAEKDLENHEQTIEQRKAEFQYLKSKFTNKQLYDWMVGQLSSTYFSAYQLAYDMSKKAERCFKYEMPECEDSFVGYGYWDSLKKGLLAGEKIENDLQRMEVNYLDRNARTYELTKNVSLQLIDAEQLVELRETGKCEFKLPETLFDLDHPGHFMRRIKSVSITIPCVAGPYAGVTARLTLGKNYIRLKPLLDDYDDTNETNNNPISNINILPDVVRQNLSYLQSIATSTAQNDSGMFNLNFNDERYLPFEGAGVADSAWTLELPEDYRSFDYRTIGDVILNINYTAKDGGDIFKEAVVDNLNELFDVDNDEMIPPIYQRIFSLKHEFGSQWHELLQIEGGVYSTKINIVKEHYPFFLRNKPIQLLAKHALVQTKNGESLSTATISVNGDNIDTSPITYEYAKLYKDNGSIVTDATGEMEIILTSPEHIENIILIFDYKVS